ncbi:hypothetical protein BPOR_0312g00110 [Botrytis porri]|uniref:Uncharacterized protein n=1 Tax=Botrytis porri TaxID=87229 RepID=A0A4Z1KSU0_9HELO|nr:hypothetical protein BPOR_0312g00110 [Botrytis porri]
MNNPDILSSSLSTMTPSTSHNPSTVQVSPSYGHSMHLMPPPEKSAERKMGIFRADSGIAIKPDPKVAIPDTDQLNSSSSALPREDLINITPTDTPGATPTFNKNITNLISKLDQLNIHLRAILTPVPDTPIVDLDDSTSISEFSTGVKAPRTSADEQEEDPSDAFTDTYATTVANDISSTIAKIDEVLAQISAICQFTSNRPVSLEDLRLKDPVIAESNKERGKGNGKEQTPIKPTVSSKLPPSSKSTKPMKRPAIKFRWVNNLFPAPKMLFRRKFVSIRQRRRMRRMKERKEKEEEKEEEIPITPTKPIQPTKPLLSSNLPPSSPFTERLTRRARIRQWISTLPPPQEAKPYEGYRALALSLFLPRKIRVMNEESRDEVPVTQTSNVLDPHFWTMRDANTSGYGLSSESPQNPSFAPPKDKHLTQPPPPKEQEKQEAEPILAGPYSEPSMTRPLISKPWLCRPSKMNPSRSSKSAGVAKEGEGGEGEGEGEKEEAKPILAGPYSEPSMTRPLTSKPWLCRPSKMNPSKKSKSSKVAKEGEKEEKEKEGEAAKTPRLLVMRMHQIANQIAEQILKLIANCIVNKTNTNTKPEIEIEIKIEKSDSDTDTDTDTYSKIKQTKSEEEEEEEEEEN